MNLKEIIRSFFTEDDIYLYSEDLYSQDDGQAAGTDREIEISQGGFIKLGDFIPEGSGSSGDFGAQIAA